MRRRSDSRRAVNRASEPRFRPGADLGVCLRPDRVAVLRRDSWRVGVLLRLGVAVCCLRALPCLPATSSPSAKWMRFIGITSRRKRCECRGEVVLGAVCGTRDLLLRELRGLRVALPRFGVLTRRLPPCATPLRPLRRARPPDDDVRALTAKLESSLSRLPVPSRSVVVVTRCKPSTLPTVSLSPFRLTGVSAPSTCKRLVARFMWASAAAARSRGVGGITVGGPSKRGDERDCCRVGLPRRAATRKLSRCASGVLLLLLGAGGGEGALGEPTLAKDCERWMARRVHCLRSMVDTRMPSSPRS